MTRRAFITLLGGAVSLFLCVSAAAQEGYYGVGHDKWHQGFYSTLKRNDGGGSCCNLMDCRPTQSRMVGDHGSSKRPPTSPIGPSSIRAAGLRTASRWPSATATAATTSSSSIACASACRRS